jgi:hypothetical protein
MSKWSDNKDPFGPFNFSDFKKWMNHQSDHDKSRLVGVKVESKIPFKKLLSRMETQNGDTYEVAKEFKKNGGSITEENGHYMYVSVSEGSFLIHRMYLRRMDG